MWCYIILEKNNVMISRILQLDHITQGYVLLTLNLVALKRGNPEPILTVKIIDWNKFIDRLGLSIKADPSTLVENNMYFVHIGYIKSPSSVSSKYQSIILTKILIFNQESYVCTK